METAPDPSGGDWRSYFTEFLPGIRDQLLIPEFESLSICFAIAIADGDDPPWRIEIERGRLRRVGFDGAEPVCTFRLDAVTLLDVMGGRVPPQEAFFAQRIDLDGDLETALKLATLLEIFCARFPFHG